MKSITVPDIGDFKDVPVIEVLIAVGDTIAQNQPVAMLESDKATLEIPSPEAGVVAAIEIQVGDKVSAGSALLKLESVGSVLQPPEVTRVKSLSEAVPTSQAPVDQALADNVVPSSRSRCLGFARSPVQAYIATG